MLLTFSAPGAAPKGLASTGDARFNRLWTLMGVPCVNVPAYVADGGLPVGVQVIARFGDDAGALEAARFVEEALTRDDGRFRDASRVARNLDRVRCFASPRNDDTHFSPIRPSVPACNRLMFSRCM